MNQNKQKKILSNNSHNKIFRINKQSKRISIMFSIGIVISLRIIE